MPDFHKPAEPRPFESYPRANSEDRLRYHPVPLAERLASMPRAPARKPSSSGLYGSGLFTTRRFGPKTAAPARRKRSLFATTSPSTSAQAQAQAASEAVAEWDDYARRLSFWLAGRREPDRRRNTCRGLLFWVGAARDLGRRAGGGERGRRRCSRLTYRVPDAPKATPDALQSWVSARSRMPEGVMTSSPQSLPPVALTVPSFATASWEPK